MQKYLDEYINSDLSLTQIANKYHIKSSDLIEYMRSKGYIINTKSNKNVMLNLHKAIEYYVNNNVSLAKVSAKFNISYSTLSINLKKLGYKVINKQTTLNINETVFDSIDTEEKAYWLGFIFADGCVYKSHSSTTKDGYRYGFTIGLKEEDYNHLIKFNKFMQSTYNKVCIKNTKFNKLCCYWQVINKHLFDILNSYGCTPRKSLTLKFPDENIFKSKDLIRHFIRGYFDGDGSLSYIRYKSGKIAPVLSILGTLNVLLNINRFSDIHSKPRLECNDSTYRICLYSTNSWKLMHYMYDDCNIYLDRKYERYLNFINGAVTEENLRNY